MSPPSRRPGEDDGRLHENRIVGEWSKTTVGLVALPGGRYVRGRALKDGPPKDAEIPEFGVYLASRPYAEAKWESRWIRWPDFRAPHSSSDAIAALRDAYERSASLKVEIACAGGTGRTGTAMAILARYAGVPPAEAVAWVRANYRSRAVETPGQRRFAARARLAPFAAGS